MEFTVGELIILSDNIKKLSLIKKVPASFGFKISLLIKELDKYLTSASISKNALIRKHGESSEEGMISVSPSNMGVFMKELNELSATTVNINIEPIEVPNDAELSEATALIGLEKIIIQQSV